jgi:hypothetical protein
MGRPHSPCGGAGNPDPSYPYTGGGFGTYGLDVASLTIKSPASFKDFMGYCSPNWVSDYTWSKMVTYRQGNPNYAPPVAAGSAVSGLLVWGRITSAGAVLEPAFRVAPPATAPTGSGDYRIEGMSADGRILFVYPVEPIHTMTQIPGMNHEEHFAAVLPLDLGVDQELARIRLVGPGLRTERISAQALIQAGRQLFLQSPAASVGRPNAVQARITWDGATYPVVMVRDPSTGEVLSFARNGAATIWTRARELELTFSDGVRSIVQTLR